MIVAKKTNKPELDVLTAKRKQAELAIAALEKQFGAGVVIKGDAKPLDVEVISTGNFAIDLAMGVLGLPRGRIAEIYGPESVGKSLLTLCLIAQAQKNDGLVALVDAEHAFDGYWGTRIGVDVPNLHIAQPDSGEQALQIVRTLVDSGAYDVIVVDSVAALTPLAELNGEIGDSHVALQPRLMSQALRVINGNVSKTNTIVIFVNQLRDKIGPMANGGSVTPGGRALKFYASTRIDLRRISTLTKDGEEIGFRVMAKIMKNKVAPPFKKVEYDVLHGKGFDNNGTILDFADQFGLVKKNGTFYYEIDENGERAEKSFGQGKTQAGAYLDENPEFRDRLRNKIIERYRAKQGYFDFEPDPTELEDEELTEDG